MTSRRWLSLLTALLVRSLLAVSVIGLAQRRHRGSKPSQQPSPREQRPVLRQRRAWEHLDARCLRPATRRLRRAQQRPPLHHRAARRRPASRRGSRSSSPETRSARCRWPTSSPPFPAGGRERIILASHYDTKRAHVTSGSSAPATAHRQRPRCWSSGASSSAGRTNSRSSCCSSTAKKRSTGTGAHRPDNTYGSRHYVDAAQEGGHARRHQGAGAARHDRRHGPGDPPRPHSTPWLVDIIWSAAATARPRRVFSNELTEVEDDHMSFLRAGVPGRGHHRPRLPAVAHSAGRSRPRQRPKPADRRRRRARLPAGHRKRAAQP